MTIAYQSSELFSPVCLVSLYSLLVNNQDQTDIHVYILSKDFTSESLDRVRDMLEAFGYDGGNAHVIDISSLDERYGLVFDNYNGKWGVDSFCKLLLGSLLPIEEHRVLYLDSDTIICDNLSDFYKINLDGYAAAGVKDFLSKEYFEYLDIPTEDGFCNSGVILVNLDYWRLHKVEDQIVTCLKKHKGFVFFSEQGVFNIVCQGKIKIAPLRFNLSTIPVALSEKEINSLRRPVNAYSQQEIILAKEKPAIIHFTSFFMIRGRAWQVSCNHPLTAIFDEYACKVANFNKSALNKKAKRIFGVVNLIPRNLLCRVVGMYYRSIRLKRYESYKRYMPSSGVNDQ